MSSPAPSTPGRTRSKPAADALVLQIDGEGLASVVNADGSVLLVGRVAGNQVDLAFAQHAGIETNFALVGDARSGKFQVSGSGGLRVGALRFDRADVMATEFGLVITAPIQWGDTHKMLAFVPGSDGTWTGSVQIDENLQGPITGAVHLSVALEVKCSSFSGADIAMRARSELDGDCFDFAIDRISPDADFSGLRQRICEQLAGLQTIEAERLERDLDAFLEGEENGSRIELDPFGADPPQFMLSSANREQRASRSGAVDGGRRTAATSSYLPSTGYMNPSPTQTGGASGYLDRMSGGYLAPHASVAGAFAPLAMSGLVEAHLPEMSILSGPLTLRSPAQDIAVRLLRTKETIHELLCESTCRPHSI